MTMRRENRRCMGNIGICRLNGVLLKTECSSQRCDLSCEIGLKEERYSEEAQINQFRQRYQ